AQVKEDQDVTPCGGISRSMADGWRIRHCRRTRRNARYFPSGRCTGTLVYRYTSLGRWNVDPLADVTAAADRVAQARLALGVETAQPGQSIVAEDARGDGTRNAIARAASQGLSRKKVLAPLAAHDLEAAARAAVAGLPAVISNFGERVRVRLDLMPALDFPA